MVKKLEINRDEFQRVVTDLESKQKFPNRTALWKAVEATDWAKAQKPRPLTGSVAGTRAKELGIRFTTEAGKLGLAMTEEQKAAMQAARKNRKPRSEKMKVFASTFEQLRRLVPERFLPMVDQAEKGSLRAAIKLNCLECSAYQPSEVKLCVVTGCAMYPQRPYQGRVSETDADVDHEVDIDVEDADEDDIDTDHEEDADGETDD